MLSLQNVFILSVVKLNVVAPTTGLVFIAIILKVMLYYMVIYTLYKTFTKLSFNFSFKCVFCTDIFQENVVRFMVHALVDFVANFVSKGQQNFAYN